MCRAQDKDKKESITTAVVTGTQVSRSRRSSDDHLERDTRVITCSNTFLLIFVFI